MVRYAFVPLVAVLALGSACSSMAPGPLPAASPAPRASGTPKPITCGISRTEDTCTPVTGAMWCPIYVWVDRKDRKVNVYPFNLKVDAAPGTPVTIVWMSLDGKFLKSKHGIVLQDPSDATHLKNGRPTDKDGFNPPERDGGANWAMDFDSTKKTGGYWYSIKYEGGGHDLDCDPTINNDGGGG